MEIIVFPIVFIAFLIMTFSLLLKGNVIISSGAMLEETFMLMAGLSHPAKFFLIFFKKGVDKRRRACYLMQAVREGGA